MSAEEGQRAGETMGDNAKHALLSKLIDAASAYVCSREMLPDIKFNDRIEERGFELAQAYRSFAKADAFTILNSTLTTENARLTEELSDEKAKHAYALGTLETEIAERVRLTERVKVLEAALAKIGDQMTLGELSENDEDCEGDFEGAYDALIHLARTTLTHGEDK